MVRAFVLASPLVVLGACSLVLDFSNKAIPKDAAIDGPYTAAECAYDEPNDSVTTAAMITTADTGPAAICAPSGGASEDDDYYKFTVPTGTTKVTFQIQFDDIPNGDLDLRLFDASGTQLVQSRSFGATETITCPNTSPPCGTLAAGDYIVEVFPGATGNINAYTFQLTLQ